MRDPLYNLFMIGDLEMFGLGADGLVYWGHFSPKGELIGRSDALPGKLVLLWRADLHPPTFAQDGRRSLENFAVNGHPDQVDPIVSIAPALRCPESYIVSFYCRMP